MSLKLPSEKCIIKHKNLNKEGSAIARYRSTYAVLGKLGGNAIQIPHAITRGKTGSVCPGTYNITLPLL